MKKITVTVALVVAVFVIGYFFPPIKKDTSAENANTPAIVLPSNQSRVWMEYAENIVRELPPPPPTSARLYAYVSTAYYETLKATRSEDDASIATRNVIDMLVPSYIATTTRQFESMHIASSTLSEAALKIQKTMFNRMQNDGFDVKWDGKRPTGLQYWDAKDPIAPQAGSWKRWLVSSSDTLTVAPPPVWGSLEQKVGLVETKKAASERTSEQSAAINFWGGVPGTEAPAGIWQNVFFAETKDYNLSNEKYAYAQMVLAQTLADAFMECWKIKYSYWTKRPSMEDSSIDLAMNNPNFPSYISGHSTVSSAAAEVLSALFPDKSDTWLADATEAKNSRLWAGIHFPYDNDEGFSLGEKVGKAAVAQLNVEALR